ncbi:YceI family protein [Spiribacter halobius]|uniref:Lipid/polyisoprenoid-binding YceI-like domain-containing protein n=1 Tax=Sediminicurvatus halobius TaxID=2182432 RepID=A0A2U2N5B8_9GAMM|nr:YceI family protein [Spiribacter halobius]PWG64282.1 hypothetical protein DEM34_05190 [Spiribacter halobius]UEX79380.1 YceI family protein [Spiribacter halobius]
MPRACLMAAALVPAVVAGTAAAEPQRFVIDESHVSVGFLAGHARFADVLGQFTEVEGEFVYDEADRSLESGRVVVAADSVYTAHEDRDGHLRDGDFLAVDEHPEIVFTATGYEPDGDDGGTLRGELTLLGTTRPLTLDLTINRIGEHPIGGAYTLGASARGSLQRSEFGMDYALEDDLVSDRIDLIIEFEAIRED